MATIVRSQLLIYAVALIVVACAAAAESDTNFLRELLVPPEIDGCLREHNIQERQISTYLKIVSKSKDRCDRLKLEFEQCLENIRLLDDPKQVFKPVDRRIQSCQRKIELEGRR